MRARYALILSSLSISGAENTFIRSERCINKQISREIITNNSEISSLLQQVSRTIRDLKFDYSEEPLFVHMVYTYVSIASHPSECLYSHDSDMHVDIFVHYTSVQGGYHTAGKSNVTDGLQGHDDLKFIIIIH